MDKVVLNTPEEWIDLARRAHDDGHRLVALWGDDRRVGGEGFAVLVAYAAPRVGDEGRAALLSEWRIALGEALGEHEAAGASRTELTVPEVAGDWKSG